MKSKKPIVSIIAPVKNEAENIENFIKACIKNIKVPYEIVIVYDSDKDNTLPMAKELTNKYKNIKLIRNTYGPGVVNATRYGFSHCNGKYLVMMAVDLTDDPKTINKMYHKLQEGYDIICPTRYSKGGKTNAPLSIKSMLSTIAGISTPFLLGIPTSDLTYSYKMFKREILEDINIESKGGFEFAEELLIKAYFKGCKLIEIPTVWIDRTAGKSKFKVASWLPSYIHWYIYALKLRANKLLGINPYSKVN